MPILISVLVTVYNVEEVLPAFLRSLVRQSDLQGVEFIFVNDASPDNSELVLRRELKKVGLENQSSIITHSQNQGVAGARQTALDAARGKYIIFFDPDDTMKERFLKQLLAVAEATGSDLVWEDYWVVNGGNRCRISQKLKQESDGLLCAILRGKVHGALWNKFIRKRFIEKNNISFLKGRITLCEDLCFLCCLLAKRPKVYYSPYCHYQYHVVVGSATHQLTLTSFESLKRVGESLDSVCRSPTQREALLHWKKGVRYTAMFNFSVPSTFIKDFFPEVRDLSGLTTHRLHKLLFWFSIRGMRSLMMQCYRWIHWIIKT